MFRSNSLHGAIILTAKTSEKLPCYMHDAARRWQIVKNAKIF